MSTRGRRGSVRSSKLDSPSRMYFGFVCFCFFFLREKKENTYLKSDIDGKGLCFNFISL